MKILDYSLIFIVILLPIILVINVSMSIKIKSQNLEIYYKNLIDSAISDASYEMKEVENSDSEVDYGYSGDGEKKVSINAEHAVNTFMNSLESNFNVKGSTVGRETLLSYIPAVAVVDYNGVHIYSAEKTRDVDGSILFQHILKPKKYFTYSYKMKYNGFGPIENKWQIVPASTPNSANVMPEIRTVNFTLNNYITYIYNSGDKKGETLRRFMQDDDMKVALFGAMAQSEAETVYAYLIEQLDEIRRQVIVNTVADEVSYAINIHNTLAKSMGTNYVFNFPTITEDDWYDVVQDTGILAFVQGMSVGNKYLNHYSYGLSKLSYGQRYWPTTGSKNMNYFGLTGVGSKMPYDRLYHKSKVCPLYEQCTPVKDPVNYLSRYDAAFDGYTPCPVCNYDTIDHYFDETLNRNNRITYDKLEEALENEEAKENYVTPPQVGENTPGSEDMVQ